VHSLDDIPARKFTDILPYKDYNENDIKDAADLISRMLKWVPSERIDCKEALKHKFFHGVTTASD
jgi:serine/threonine protein kinase